MDEGVSNEFLRRLDGCQAVFGDGPITGGGNDFGAAPATDATVPLRLAHALSVDGTVDVTVYADDQILLTRSYAEPFLRSGGQDQFEVVSKDRAFRLLYWGSPTCP